MSRAIRCAKRCMRRVKGFAIRATIISIALAAVFTVALWTGELVPWSLAVQRIAEAMGYALADTFADNL
jgi:hypothetical protein